MVSNLLLSTDWWPKLLLSTDRWGQICYCLLTEKDKNYCLLTEVLHFIVCWSVPTHIVYLEHGLHMTWTSWSKKSTNHRVSTQRITHTPTFIAPDHWFERELNFFSMLTLICSTRDKTIVKVLASKSKSMLVMITASMVSLWRLPCILPPPKRWNDDSIITCGSGDRGESFIMTTLTAPSWSCAYVLVKITCSFTCHSTAPSLSDSESPICISGRSLIPVPASSTLNSHQTVHSCMTLTPSLYSEDDVIVKQKYK